MDRAVARGADSLTGGSASPDEEMLSQALAAVRPALRRYLRRRVPTSEVEDLLQVVSLEMWRSWFRFRPGGSLEAWAFGIAHHRSADWWRNWGRQPALGVAADLTDPDLEPGEAVAVSVTARAALAALPDGPRTAVTLAYFGGYTQPEIASQMGLPLGTVKSWVTRSLRHMAASLLDADTGD